MYRPIRLMSAGLLLCLSLIVPVRSFSADKERVDKLIRQFKGEKCYWDSSGNETGYFDSWTVRHFDEWCKITAAKFLGEMGPEARQAVPVLIEALQNGLNDIETGDGKLPYRSTIAVALGKIGDPLAIPPLIERLKVKEPASLSSGASPRSDYRELTMGIDHPAIVKALGMFGSAAKAAIPILEKLQTETKNDELKQLTAQVLTQIKEAKPQEAR